MRKRLFKASSLALLWVVLDCLLFSQPLLAQTSPAWPMVFQVPATGLNLLSIDRFDRTYLADAKQNILQIDTTGKVLSRFSPPTQGHIGMLEAWSLAKITIFYDDRQRVVLLDRFLTQIGQVDLRDYTDGTIRATTLASDDRLWLFDETSFRLLKVDTRFTQTLHETPLELTLGRKQYDLQFLREYQSKLYLVDRMSGIYVFDNLGNYQQKIPVTGLSYIGFIGDELYYFSNNQLHFQHLYNLKTRTLHLPASTQPYRQVLVGDKLLYLLTAETLSAYRWR